MIRRAPLRRSPLSRGTKPLKRTRLARGTKRLRRRVPLKAFNAERRARLYERNFGAYSDFIRLLPCAVPGCKRRDTEAAHVVKCRQMGGCGGDKTGLAPLCGSRLRPGHHDESEGNVPEFSEHYGVDLRAYARWLWAEYGATEKYVAFVVSGSPAEVARRWAELAKAEAQG